MKRFELWQYDKETESIEEAGIASTVKSIVSRVSRGIKSLFKLSRFKFGQSKKTKLKVPLPSSLSEAISNQKNNGTQTEMLCGYYLAKELGSMGFEVELRLENKKISPQRMMTEINTLQKRIVSNALDGTDPSKSARIKTKQERGFNTRKNIGLSTAKRLSDVVKSDLDGYPNMFTVYIDSAGYAGEGKTKADIELGYEVKKMSQSEVLPKLKTYAISHKYNWEKAMGTQINSVMGLVYAVVTGEGAKEAGSKKVKSLAAPMIAKKFGPDFEERLRFLWGRKSQRKDGETKEYEEKITQFYRWVAKLIEQNPLNLIKFIGIEEGVDHFMVNFNKSEKNYSTFSSIDSKKYNDLVTKMYDEEFRKEVSVKAKVVGVGEISISFFWRGNKFYENNIKAQETNIGKSKSVVGGLGVDDMSDAEVVYPEEFKSSVAKKLKPKTPRNKRKTLSMVRKRPSQSAATELWWRAADKWVKNSNDRDKDQLVKTLMKNKEESIQYIMGGLSPKEAIDIVL